MARNEFARGFKAGVDHMLQRQHSAEDVKQMIASFSIALHNKHPEFSRDDILEILEETQFIWDCSVRDNRDLIQDCYDLTGIEIQKKED